MTSPNRSSSAEKASGLSAGAGWQERTRENRPATWTTCFHTTVLPIPASPEMATAAGAPDVADRKAQISAISVSRPTGCGSTFHPRIGCNTSGHQ
jgi:hypothetical protein